MANKTQVYNSINIPYKDLGDGSFAEITATNIEEHSNDAFGRLRASALHTIFESTLQYGKMGLLWGESLTGSATSTHLPNESSVRKR